jgi:hypothetical protein
MLLEFIRIMAATHSVASCLTQLLSGRDALLPRALAVPLHINGFWDAPEPHECPSSPGEQLYALIAALEAASDGGAPGKLLVAVAELQLAKLGMQPPRGINMCCPLKQCALATAVCSLRPLTWST